MLLLLFLAQDQLMPGRRIDANTRCGPNVTVLGVKLRCEQSCAKQSVLLFIKELYESAPSTMENASN